MVLAGAVTTTEWAFYTAYVDLPNANTGFTPGANDGTSNGATNQTIIAAPGATTARQVKMISIVNKDTVLGTVTVQLLSTATRRTLINLPLNPNEELTFIDGVGWMAFDVNGNVKSVGTIGPTGAQGIQGLYGGAVTLDYKWDTGTTDADPGAGLIRGNNATTASITILYIDLVDQNSQTLTAVIDTFDGSTSTTKAHIRLVKKTDVTKWMLFTMSARATASGYRKLTVAQVSQSAASPFASGDEILIEFTRVGDLGATGSTGAPGATQTGINLGNGGAALSANYTTVLGDAGLELQHAVGDNNARTFTIDSNANVAYPVGTVLLFVNLKNTLTIAITSDTMTLVNSATTGSRTLAVNGVAVAIKVGTTSWIIGGSGLT
jgi:hypothetical protein